MAALVLTRGGTGAVTAAGPGVRALVGALRTAGLALVCVLALASVVLLVVLLASADELTADDVWALLMMLPNIGALGLALAWGAPLDVRWDFGSWNRGRESLGYGELSDLAGGWAVFGRPGRGGWPARCCWAPWSPADAPTAASSSWPPGSSCWPAAGRRGGRGGLRGPLPRGVRHRGAAASATAASVAAVSGTVTAATPAAPPTASATT
ncbi:hypothetical protein IHE61_03265 [Streptomyces sp. GKU 257-1]|nr:hypothetical protein [Streptomyces sp. GKU 257-1]